MVHAARQMWVEKYRPETLDEIRGNEAEVQRLKQWVDDEAAPNMLLSGPQGTGKTAAARAFCKEKYGDDWQNHVLEMNASDERGIDVVRDKIKTFAAEGGVLAEHDFNVAILDESDSMTRDAQPAMRRVMEDFHDRTRFILLCNYSSRIIDPIQSRCAPLRMSPLADDQILELLHDVAGEEGVDFEDEQLWEIAKYADGDARRAIHTLQSAVVDGSVTDVSLEAVVSMVDRAAIEEIVELALGGAQEDAVEALDSLLEEGADPGMLAEEFLVVVKERREDLPADSWALLLDDIASAEWRTMQGASPKIQFHNLVASMAVSRHVGLANYRGDGDE